VLPRRPFAASASASRPVVPSYSAAIVAIAGVGESWLRAERWLRARKGSKGTCSERASHSIPRACASGRWRPCGAPASTVSALVGARAAQGPKSGQQRAVLERVAAVALAAAIAAAIAAAADAVAVAGLAQRDGISEHAAQA
jgi:hypothetical protein